LVKFSLMDQLVIGKNPWAGMGRKKPFYLKKAPVTVWTPPATKARIALAEAGIGARGRSIHEVWAAVVSACGGKDHGGAAAADSRKRMRYAQGDASVARMRKILAGKA